VKIDILQLEFIDSNLRSIVMMVESKFEVEFTITSLYRIGDDGVHGTLPLRGIDLRCRDLDFGDMVAKYINDKWIYDPDRPHKNCAWCHDTGRGLHLHFQSHPNTIRRNS
jgi:hypothetical protein